MKKEVPSQQQFLQDFREAFPFLYKIPDHFYFQLNIRELHMPSPSTQILIKELEKKLNQHIITYNSTIFDLLVSPEQHLCAQLGGAMLSEEQKLLLAQYEKRTKKEGISLVVYQKPIILAKLEETPLYKYYLDYKLL